MLGLCCRGFSPVVRSEGCCLAAVPGRLTGAAPCLVEHGLRSTRASVGAAAGLGRRLSSCGGRAQVCSTWGLPGSGIEPVSPALAGEFFATELPGKHLSGDFEQGPY